MLFSSIMIMWVSQDLMLKGSIYNGIRDNAVGNVAVSWCSQINCAANPAKRSVLMRFDCWGKGLLGSAYVAENPSDSFGSDYLQPLTLMARAYNDFGDHRNRALARTIARWFSKWSSFWVCWSRRRSRPEQGIIWSFGQLCASQRHLLLTLALALRFWWWDQ